jgi:hypothetical protein
MALQKNNFMTNDIFTVGPMNFQKFKCSKPYIVAT